MPTPDQHAGLAASNESVVTSMSCAAGTKPGNGTSTTCCRSRRFGAWWHRQPLAILNVLWRQGLAPCANPFPDSAAPTAVVHHTSILQVCTTSCGIPL